MKKIFFILIIALFSCDSNTSKDDLLKTFYTTSTINLLPTLAFDSTKNKINSTKNLRDKNGLKQGVWDYNENGYLKGFETYKNDKLDGPFRYWINYPGQIIEGQYDNGIKQDLWKFYQNDTSLAMVVKYVNGIEEWDGFPLADMNYPEPHKGFNINTDSVFIQCPYANDTIWYKGLFIGKKAVGIHKMFYPNGKIKFEYNYNTGKFKVYNKEGKFKKEFLVDTITTIPIY